MAHKIIDTNVPLIAAGMNKDASERCEDNCGEIISQIIKGEIVVVLDEAERAISEYRNNMYPDPKGTRTGQFLMYLLLNLRHASRVHTVSISVDEQGNYRDYPDNTNTWSTDVPRCERFDQDDKKWVALATRFKRDTGTDAPIVNAADRCWLAFEPQLESAGVKLEVLCRDER